MQAIKDNLLCIILTAYSHQSWDGNFANTFPKLKEMMKPVN